MIGPDRFTSWRRSQPTEAVGTPDAGNNTVRGGNDRMRTTMAAAGTVVFFLLAPGVVVGIVPWLLTGWHVGQPWPYWAPLRVVGVVLLIGGIVVLVHAFVRFVVEGLGTPAPIAPTEHLVVGGLY